MRSSISKDSNLKQSAGKNIFASALDILQRNIYPIATCLCVAAALFAMWTFTGQWPWKAQAYNSYILQAQSWLQGRLDLGQNYEYLELAVFNGKYYVSFPPFPSYVMLPFLIFGWEACGPMLAFAASILGALYAFKISDHFCRDQKVSMFFALFVTVGSNWLFTAQNAYVWFIAQNMSFALMMMAIYYALKNKAGLSLFFWACAVGCRPFVAMFVPVLLYIIYKRHMLKNPDDKLSDIIKKRYIAVIPMAVIALSYMILNYARFGSIIEFGHNYLPEHTRSALGQFSVQYIKDNIGNLLRLPEVNEKGIWEYPQFNGMCIFIVSPIFISYVVYFISAFFKKEKPDIKLSVMIFVLSLIYLILLTMHVQLGGSHFGNRYTNDILPMIFLGIAAVLPKNGKFTALNYPLMIMGMVINVVGTINWLI